MGKNLFLTLLFSVFVLSGILLFADNSQAQVPMNPTCQSLGLTPEEGLLGVDFLTFQKAIVPCGRKCRDTRTPYNELGSCTLCHLLIMIKNIFDLLFAWLIIVALIFITIAGVMYIVSAGNPGMKAFAKGMITKTLTGFIVFILSWILVYTVLNLMSARTGAGGMLGLGSTNWFQFTCNVDSPFDRP